MYGRLEAIASDEGVSVSQCIRGLLERGTRSLAHPASALDEAIAVLQSMRRGVDDPPRAPQRSESTAVDHVDAGRPDDRSPPDGSTHREVNVLNAKANLSRLVADVARGDEVVIVHAGAPRARLVPVDGA